MDTTMHLLASTLTRMGAESSYTPGKLTVKGTTMVVQSGRARNGAPGLRIVGVGKYTDYKHGGYKVAEMVRDVLERLPSVEAQAKKDALLKDKAAFIADLRKTHKGDGRITRVEYTWDEKLSFTFVTDDPTTFQIVLDRIHEIEDYSYGEREVAPSAPSGPRMYILVDDNNEQVGEPFGLLDALQKTLDHDRVADMIVGELFVEGDFRMMRV